MDLVESIYEVSHDGNDTTMDEITNSKDREKNEIVSISINNHYKTLIFNKCRYVYLILFGD